MRGQDPGRLDQAVDVVRRRLPAHEDHVLARLAAFSGCIRVEHDLAGGRARGGIQAFARDVVARGRVEHRVQELVELAGIDARDRLLARDQPLLHHLDRGSERGRRCALRAPGLEEVELALLDRELDVLHVAVVLLEALDRLHQLVEGLRHPLLHRLERLRRANAGDDVLPLRVGEELAVQAALAGGRIAGEENAGAAVVALVAEDHLHDVDRGAEIVGDALRGAVDLRARRVPGFEDGADGAAQLLARVGGEQTARLGRVDPTERRDQLGEVVAVELHVLLDPSSVLQVAQRLLEAVPVDSVHDLAVHLDQASVRVVGEALVAGRGCKPLRRLLVQAEVEDRVHHSGHRYGRPGANGDEQGIVRVAEGLAGFLLEGSDVLGDLLFQPVRQVAAVRPVGAAGLGRDREPGGNGDSELRHFRQADALAAEQLATAVGMFVEVKDVPHRPNLSICGGNTLGPCRCGTSGTARRRPGGASRGRRAGTPTTRNSTSRSSSSWCPRRVGGRSISAAGKGAWEPSCSGWGTG